MNNTKINFLKYLVKPIRATRLVATLLWLLSCVYLLKAWYAKCITKNF